MESARDATRRSFRSSWPISSASCSSDPGSAARARAGQVAHVADGGHLFPARDLLDRFVEPSLQTAQVIVQGRVEGGRGRIGHEGQPCIVFGQLSRSDFLACHMVHTLTGKARQSVSPLNSFGSPGRAINNRRSAADGSPFSISDCVTSSLRARIPPHRMEIHQPEAEKAAPDSSASSSSVVKRSVPGTGRRRPQYQAPYTPFCHLCIHNANSPCGSRLIGQVATGDPHGPALCKKKIADSLVWHRVDREQE